MEGCLELTDNLPGDPARLGGEAESALIRRAQEGDRDAFEALVRTYDQTVLRLALHLVHSPEEARDLYQEAFLKVYRSIGGFRLEARFSTWLYRIVMNVCLDHLRSRGTHKEVQAPEGPDGQTEFFQTVKDDGVNPERAVCSKEIGHRIEAALSQLNPRERIVFELKHYQGLKLRAIGEICHTSEQTVKNCLFRATQKLRAQLCDLA
jgi:RNA polymerase sigma-70 factor, ECF subfamily